MSKLAALLVALLLVLIVVMGCSDRSVVSQNGIEVNQAHIYLPAVTSDGTTESSVAAAYMVIENVSGKDDRLIGVNCDFADAELHTMSMEGDMMKMSPVDAFELPNEGGLILQSGGNHIMFLGLGSNIRVGDEKQVVLQFENAGSVVVPMLVTAEK